MHAPAPLLCKTASSFDWLDRVAVRFNGGREEAFRALKAVLTTMRDVLPVESAVVLSTRIPLLIRGVFFDGYEPARAPIRLSDASAFVGEVERRLQSIAPADASSAMAIDPKVAVDAVIAVVADHLDPVTAGTIQKNLPVVVRARAMTADVPV